MDLRRFWDEVYPYHLTTKCRPGMKPFANPDNAGFVKDFILEARRRDDILLLAYCIMPNHLHLCVVPRAKDLSAFMADLKRNTAKHVKQGSIWLRRFHDNRIESLDKLRNIVHYIHNNPVRAGLVTRAESFAFSSASNWESLDFNLFL